MRSLNKLCLIGNVGSKYELRHSGEMKIINLSLATSEKKKNGEEDTQWHRLVAFGATAEVIDKYVQKGSKLYVEGKLTYGKFKNKDGVEVSSSDIIVQNLIMLSNKSEDGGNGERKDRFKISDEYNSSRKSDYDEDLPF